MCTLYRHTKPVDSTNLLLKFSKFAKSAISLSHKTSQELKKSQRKGLNLFLHHFIDIFKECVSLKLYRLSSLKH